MFTTEQEAVDYSENDNTIALYSTTDDVVYNFVRVVGVKTDIGNLERILQDGL